MNHLEEDGQTQEPKDQKPEHIHDYFKKITGKIRSIKKHCNFRTIWRLKFLTGKGIAQKIAVRLMM